MGMNSAEKVKTLAVGMTRAEVEAALGQQPAERARSAELMASFSAVAAANPDLPVWIGELYLETHRGTYTTQAKTKLGNRRSEIALRKVVRQRKSCSSSSSRGCLKLCT